MKTLRPLPAALAVVAALVIVRPAAAQPDAALAEHQLARENVLGTSLDLTVVCGDRATAERCLHAAQLAIDEACHVLSTYEAGSEISRLNALDAEAQRAHPLSPLLGGLLERAHRWQARSGGAFDPCIAPLVALWKQAEGRGAPPTAEELAAVVSGAEPRFALVREGGGLRLSGARACSFDLNAIAKGTVIDIAVAAARSVSPRVRGVCLNIGGDIGTWGARADGGPWEIRLADPANPADNAPPLATVAVAAGRAVATSGGYARYRTIEGVRYSHLLDPRTGRPVDHVRSASVVAADAETADVLATILTVLPIERGIALVDATPGAACLVVDRDLGEHRSAAWAGIELPAAVPAFDPFAADEVLAPQFARWKKGYQLDVTFTLADSGSGSKGFKRHFVAVWVEDRKGRIIKILALWAQQNELKYLQKLNDFWKAWEGSVIQQNDANLLTTLSKATRKPGEYTVTWDGTTQFGQVVPQDTYAIHIDINREHGPSRERHTHVAAAIKCGSAKKSGKIPDEPELKGVAIEYGKAPDE